MSIQDSLSVDGATKSNPGPSQYQGVDHVTGKKLFFVDIGVATNNIAEFCALGHAIFHCKQSKYTTIYTDSSMAITWVYKKRVTSSLQRSRETITAKDYIRRIEVKLQPLDIQRTDYGLLIDGAIKVVKWDTKTQGEIPADFGNKK